MKLLDFNNVRFAILHHADFEFGNRTAAQCMSTIKDWHLERGWDDVGYHYVIKGNSFVDARPIQYQGAHCRLFNPYSIGFCVAADLCEREPTDQEVYSTVSAIQDAQKIIGRKLLILGHNQLAATECPGPSLVRRVNKLFVS